jgi:hypothetical protein
MTKEKGNPRQKQKAAGQVERHADANDGHQGKHFGE